MNFFANEASTPLDLRDALMVTVRAAATLPAIELDDEIQDRLQNHAQQLAHYRQLEQRDFPGPGSTRSQRLQHLLLRRGFFYEEASIAWPKELQKTLRQKD